MLHYAVPAIIEKINQYLGGSPVSKITFKHLTAAKKYQPKRPTKAHTPTGTCDLSVLETLEDSPLKESLKSFGDSL